MRLIDMIEAGGVGSGRHPGFGGPDEHLAHPFHQTAVDAGLKFSNTFHSGAKTIHTYLPDHHWKTGVQLVTQTHEGRADKHTWRGNNMARGDTPEGLKAHLDNDKAGYDKMVADHKAGRGAFAPGSKY